MNIKQALKFSEDALETEQSKVDAQYLLSYLFQKTFTWLKTWPDIELTQVQVDELHKLVERRKTGEPIAYITGEKDFWTLQLLTNSSTLIPRPETELLVESGLEFLNDIASAKVLDLGTGTGAIALSIASERVNDQVTASDHYIGAVELATKNAKINNISNVKIIQSDWFKQIEEEPFNLILSNPPYVDENDPHLFEGDLIFEPNTALIANDNGLSDIKIIITQSLNYLVGGGGLMIEHGFEQGLQIRKLFEQAGFIDVKILKDLAGLDRVTMGIKPC